MPTLHNQKPKRGDVTFLERDGVDLCVRLWPINEPVAIVHVLHGLAEHSARYGRFSDALNAAGFAVIAHDHRGHGRTEGTNAPFGMFSRNRDGVDLILSDVSAVEQHAREMFGDLPIILFGHSMGGLIAMNFALRNAEKLAGCALWNSNFDGGIAGRFAQLILRYEAFRLGSDVPSRILPRLTFQAWAKQIKDRRTAFDWLSNIEAEVDAYIADPLCGWHASVAMWRDIFQLIYSGGDVADASLDAKRLPFHFLGGGEDPATNFAKATRNQVQRMQNAGFEDVEIQIFEDARHETLNDHVQSAATEAFLKWANDLIPK
ncbi:MAG: alpha/beta hydrolase [Pseudomonadota bacterium]